MKLVETLKYIYKWFRNIPQRWRHLYEQELIARHEAIEDKFTLIYAFNFWRTKESVSGPYATLEQTLNLRRELPEFFRKFSIKSVFDAPCGDMNWMQLVLHECDIDYTGGDIVRELVDINNGKYQNDTTRFIHIDLTRSRFPAADLMLCRDSFCILSFADARAILGNFLASTIGYFVSTSYLTKTPFTNKDNKTGRFHRNNLFLPPYNFPASPLARIRDGDKPGHEKELCLWTKDQVAAALAAWGAPLDPLRRNA